MLVGVAVAAGCTEEYEVCRYSLPVIVTASLPEGEVGVAYPEVQLAVTGAPAPYTWSDVNGTLQTYGLSLDPRTGRITGTPTEATPSDGVTVTISVTDALNNTAQKDFTLVIHPRLMAPRELQITTTSLPDGYDGQTGYLAALTATGGTGSYTWSILSGSLPPFLNFNSSGLISGDIAPDSSTKSPYNLTIQVTDGQQTAQVSLSITVYPQLQMTTTSLPNGYDGQTGYSATLTASGGTGSYTWSVLSGSLPSYLSFDSSGQISGDIASDASTRSPYNLTIQVTDGQQTVSKPFVLVVETLPTVRADFEANPTYGKAPLSVTFTDKSTGLLTQWQWDFDDDGTVDSNAQNPTYTYNDPGWYTVKLTVSDGMSTDTCVKKMYVLVANNVYYVDGVNGDDGNGGTDWSDAFATIGKALSVASDYDLVLVADATYNETDLDFQGKKIFLKGVDYHSGGLTQPVINCFGGGRAFHFGSGESRDAVVYNFTIENGSSAEGGAIYCESSSPSIVSCIFVGNSAEYGGAIFCTHSSPSITNCTFTNNHASKQGGAICSGSSSPSITDCTFTSNNADDYGGAISHYWSGGLRVVNCVFEGNKANYGGAVSYYMGGGNIINSLFSGNHAHKYGGAIDCFYQSGFTMTGCTLSGNSAGDHGGAVNCWQYSGWTFNNSIVWGNSARCGSEIYIDTDTSCSCKMNYCCADIRGYYAGWGSLTEDHCIHSNPKFVDAANDDYHLKPDSPCIDAGKNSYVPGDAHRDLDGNKRIVDSDRNGVATVDIGAYEFQP